MACDYIIHLHLGPSQAERPSSTVFLGEYEKNPKKKGKKKRDQGMVARPSNVI